MRRARILALLLVCGCGGPSGDVPPPTHAADTDCAAFISEYRQVLASAPNECEADTDCAVYGGLDPEAVCGGATDAATARRLREIGDSSDAAGCPRPGYSCPAIDPRCVDGACTSPR